MKIFRRVLFIILCIVLAFIAAGFLLPRKVHVERKLLFNATQKSIFEQVNTLKNWIKWAPWLQQDTSVQLLFSGPEYGIGAKLTWQSTNTNVGNGSASIISSSSPDSLQVVFDYNEKGKSTGRFHFIKEQQNTNVLWELESDLGMNPVSRWVGLFSDRMIGPDLEEGLFNLDQMMQDTKTVFGYEIINIEVPARILISVRDTASPQTVAIKLTSMYNKIALFLKSKNLSPTGNPMAVFYNYKDGNFDIEAGVPIASITSVPSGLNCSERVAQKAVMLKYFGPYTMISKAYNALHSYLDVNELQVNGAGWEEYITNPITESDSSKRQTNIYFPLE